MIKDSDLKYDALAIDEDVYPLRRDLFERMSVYAFKKIKQMPENTPFIALELPDFGSKLKILTAESEVFWINWYENDIQEQK